MNDDIFLLHTIHISTDVLTLRVQVSELQVNMKIK